MAPYWVVILASHSEVYPTRDVCKAKTKYVCFRSPDLATLRFSVDPKAFYIVFAVRVLFNTF